MVTATMAHTGPGRDGRSPGRRTVDDAGFSLVEMMIAAALTMVVVGAAVALSTSIQTLYSYELDDAAVQQEARFAMEWITRTIAGGGSNPYDIGGDVAATLSCTAETPGFEIDPDGDTINDDIRITADVNPPNGLLAGDATECDNPGEDVIITHDAAARTITRQDAALDAGPETMTDAVVTSLRFTYLDSNRAAAATQAAIAYVQVDLTVQSKATNPYTGEPSSYSYTSEVRVRGR